jgi:hypothetical protein
MACSTANITFLHSKKYNAQHSRYAIQISINKKAIKKTDYARKIQVRNRESSHLFIPETEATN